MRPLILPLPGNLERATSPAGRMLEIAQEFVTVLDQLLDPAGGAVPPGAEVVEASTPAILEKRLNELLDDLAAIPRGESSTRGLSAQEVDYDAYFHVVRVEEDVGGVLCRAAVAAYEGFVTECGRGHDLGVIEIAHISAAFQGIVNMNLKEGGKET